MVDTIPSARRSWNMPRIRSQDTAPEIRVRSALHALGFRFRLHRRDLPGTPDVILPKHRTVIFVHGCFWHRHLGCTMAYTPKTRTHFWEQKFVENIKRDTTVERQLECLGWTSIVVWGCETEDWKGLSSLLAGQLRTQHRRRTPRHVAKRL